MTAPTSAVALVLARLEGVKKVGGGFVARCPAHEDHDPSLSVKEGDDGKALLCCQAGCATEDVLAAAKLTYADLFPPTQPAHDNGSAILNTYDYTDEVGAVLFQVVRMTPKAFRQRRPDGKGGWEWKLGDVRRVLYNLADVRDAVKAGVTVYVVEGEKDADALARAGEVATTNPGGAGKWRPEYAEVLRGADVVVVADRDEPGRAHAAQVVRSLEGVASTVAVVEPAQGKDAADHLAAGLGVEDFEAPAEVAEPPPSEPPGDYDEPSPEGDPPVLLFRRWTTAELLDAERSFSWQVRGLMVRGTYGMVGGERKTLKSYFGTFIDVAVAAGVPVFGHFGVDSAAPVVAYVGEGGRVPYTNRLERIARAMGVDLRSTPLFPVFDTAPVQSLRFQASLERDLGELKPALVSLDPLYAYHGVATNAANLFEEGALLTSLSGPCVDAGASLKVTTHFNKSGTGRGLDRLTMAGAQEWSDSWWLLSHREPPNVAAGEFRLLLDVGSRQWGGSTWDLDLSIGRFNVDTGEFEGDIAWRLSRHTGEGDSDEERVLRIATDNPFALTREQLAKAAGGQLQRMRQVTHNLEAKGLLVARLCCVRRSNGRTDQAWHFGPASELGRTETEEAS